MKSILKKTITATLVLAMTTNFVLPARVFAQQGLPPCNGNDPTLVPGVTCDKNAAPAQVASKVDNGNGLGFIANAALAVPGWIAAGLVLPVANWITSIAGLLLNQVVDFSVVHMKTNIYGNSAPGSTQTGDVITSNWVVVRNVANMLFIFFLLYTAIMTMFGKANYRQVIVNLVLAAILINFSLFFTKIIIDFGNLIAITFYKAITGPIPANSTALNWGISNAIMDNLHIQSIASNVGRLDGLKLLIIGILGSAVALIAAFIFIAIAAMLLIRFAVLILVMILSPLMFAGWIVPYFQSYRTQWWNALIGQTFFAPAYFFMTWIVVNVGQGLYKTLNVPAGLTMAQALTATQGANNQYTYSVGALGLLINFAVMIIFLVASLLIAKGIAGRSGPGINKLTGQVVGWSTGKMAGLTARGAQTTLGRLSQRIADSEALKDRAPNSRLARLALVASEKGAKSSFDVRGTALGGFVGAGKAPKKSSFADTVAATKKREEAFAKTLKPAGGEVINFETERAKADLKKELGGDYADKRKSEATIKALVSNRETELADRGRELGDVRRKATDASKSDAERKVAADRAEKLEREIKVINDYTAKQSQADKLKEDGNKRVESYAQSLERPNVLDFGKFSIPMPDTARVLLFGKLGRENKEAAMAIRKSMNEKSDKDKFAELATKIGKEATEEEKGEETPAAGGEKPAGEGGKPTTS